MVSRRLNAVLAGSSILLSAGAMAEGPKIGFEYRAGITHDDGKLVETEGTDAQASTMIELEAANLTAAGEGAKNVKYTVAYNLLSSNLDIGRVDYQLVDMATLVMGVDKINQGGWYYKDYFGEFRSTKTGAAQGFGNTAALEDGAATIGVKLALAGTLSINALNDVKNVAASEGVEAENSWAKNDSDKSKAFTVEWTGDFQGWMPLVQLASYDLGKSMAYSLGVKGKVADLGLLLNYTTDNRKNFSVNTKDGEVDVYTQIDAHFSYDVAGVQPFVGFHQFNVKQGGTDAKFNTSSESTDENFMSARDVSGYDKFNDNVQVIALGLNCTAISESYVPYLTLNSISAKFDDEDDMTKESSETGMVIKAGVAGIF